MTYNYTISESERERILGEHELTLSPTLIREKIDSFRFTSDFKYVVFENQFYSCETGELMPLLEKWSLSDILHTIGDAASVGMDFIIPGSGAIVDVINALSYGIEALFQKDKTKRSKLLIMGAITLAFVVLPGPLQAFAVPMKRFVKYGAKKALSKGVVEGLALISKNLGKILGKFPELASKAIGSKLGKKVFGKSAKKIMSKLDDIANGIRKAFTGLADDAAKSGSKSIPPPSEEELTRLARNKLERQRKGGVVRRTTRTATDIGTLGTTKLARMAFRSLKDVFKSLRSGEPIKFVRLARKAAERELHKSTPKVTGKYLSKAGFQNPNLWSSKFLKNLGITKGHVYSYLPFPGSGGKFFPKPVKVRVVNVSGDKVALQKVYSKSGQKLKGETFPFEVSHSDFIVNAVGAPWGRRGSSRVVPFFIKRMADLILPESGAIDVDKLERLPDLSPSETSLASQEYLRDDFEVEDQDVQYTVDPKVMTIQKSLILLGYPFKTGADGKYGPETRNNIKRFQEDHDMLEQDGGFDRATAKAMALQLKARNIPNSQDLQNVLNSF